MPFLDDFSLKQNKHWSDPPKYKFEKFKNRSQSEQIYLYLNRQNANRLENRVYTGYHPFVAKKAAKFKGEINHSYVNAGYIMNTAKRGFFAKIKDFLKF